MSRIEKNMININYFFCTSSLYIQTSFHSFIFSVYKLMRTLGNGKSVNYKGA